MTRPRETGDVPTLPDQKMSKKQRWEAERNKTKQLEEEKKEFFLQIGSNA